MTKTVCDICGKEMPTLLHTNNSNIIENLKFCISSHGKAWDICDECRERLNGWMTASRQETDRQTPCDLCRFDPPGSGDGKPCTMCPAESRSESEEV